jgi:hypothetical protein
MDVWSSIILVVNILLLIAGWLLFQQAKSDLTARAAQIPVLSEVKALHQSITALLEQLKMESGHMSAQLDARCVEASRLLAALERSVDAVESERKTRTPSRKPVSAVSDRKLAADSSTGPPMGAIGAANRRDLVITLADKGASSAEIAQQSGLSVDEVELVLSLRHNVA